MPTAVSASYSSTFPTATPPAQQEQQKNHSCGTLLVLVGFILLQCAILEAGVLPLEKQRVTGTGKRSALQLRNTSVEEKLSAKLKGSEPRLNLGFTRLQFRMQSVIGKIVKNKTDYLCRTLASISEQKASHRQLFQ
ncbi:hypothetical protein FK519_27935 [Klebsiella pneumoniae]|nr:hypothetical protein [Klebsiella pneumoniae]